MAAWIPASTAAPGRSNCLVARVHISTSMVVTQPPPSTTITPKLVRQKRNTITDAARKEGATSGSSTVRFTRRGLSPASRAESSRSASTAAMAVPVILTTTARLKQTCVAMIAHHVPRRSTGPVGPSREANAAATTTDGNTNGMVATVRSNRRPLNSLR